MHRYLGHTQQLCDNGGHRSNGAESPIPVVYPDTRILQSTVADRSPQYAQVIGSLSARRALEVNFFCSRSLTQLQKLMQLTGVVAKSLSRAK